MENIIDYYRPKAITHNGRITYGGLGPVAATKVYVAGDFKKTFWPNN